MANLINWFEIPVANIERASKFYAEVLGGELNQMEMMGTKMAFLPMDGEGVGGSLCQGDGYKPTTDGAKIYLNGGEDLNTPLSKVEKAGGKIVMPKTKINDEIGYMAFFVDTEGNNMAFHSSK
ncbi:MAG: VOC family protein [Ignavibacteria bacterium]|nr:VOC family protein [Ignavibacteria bacterium]MBT8383319.1 VOC family protein [Ignavibacteria bacterium]MBT8391391.1 VOC family protein [Ignavibacteria bacterium]NNJ52431.1 VOC family protein [Ignavibacteriaceae bacterium]NNL22556.1 VOC family protein [Ignavibacteriaceae bacterium]